MMPQRFFRYTEPREPTFESSQMGVGSLAAALPVSSSTSQPCGSGFVSNACSSSFQVSSFSHSSGLPEDSKQHAQSACNRRRRERHHRRVANQRQREREMRRRMIWNLHQREQRIAAREAEKQRIHSGCSSARICSHRFYQC